MPSLAGTYGYKKPKKKKKKPSKVKVKAPPKSVKGLSKALGSTQALKGVKKGERERVKRIRAAAKIDRAIRGETVGAREAALRKARSAVRLQALLAAAAPKTRGDVSRTVQAGPAEKKPEKLSRAEQIGLAVDLGVIEPAKWAGVLPEEKTLGQKIYQGTAQIGPAFIPGGIGATLARRVALRTAGGAAAVKAATAATQRVARKVTKPKPPSKVAPEAAPKPTALRRAQQRSADRAYRKKVKLAEKRQGIARERKRAKRALKRQRRGERIAQARAAQRPKAMGAADATSAIVAKGVVAGGGVAPHPAVRGHVEAVRQKPGKVLATTGRAIPGIITAPIGIAASAAKAAGLGIQERNVLGIPLPQPTFEPSKATTAPLEEEWRYQKEFAKGIGEMLTSDSVAEVKKKVEDEYGLTLPIIAGIPAARAARKPYRAVRTKVRRAEETRRLKGGKQRRPPTAEPQPVFKKTERHFERKQESKRVATARAGASKEGTARAKPVVREGQKASGRGVEIRKDKGGKAVKIYEGDAVGLVQELGLPRNNPAKAKQLIEQELAFITRTRDKLQRERDKGGAAAALEDNPLYLGRNRVNRIDMLNYLLANPKVLKNPAFWKSVDAYRGQNRVFEKGDINTSKRAAYAPTAHSHGFDVPSPKAPKDKIDTFVKEMEGFVDKEGLEHPVWRAHVDARPTAGTGGFPSGVAPGVKGREGTLQALGATEESLSSLARESIGVPVNRKHIYSQLTDFLEERHIEHKGQREFSQKQAGQLADEGVFNLGDTALIDAGQYNRGVKALLDPETPNDLPLLRVFDEALILADRDALTRMAPKKGRKYQLVPREALKEQHAQLLNTMGDVGVEIGRFKIGPGQINRATSRLILGTSPAWLAMQFLAEGGQALVAVGPHHFVRGMRAVDKLSPEQQYKFAALAGETPGVVGSPKSLKFTLREGDIDGFRDTMGRMNRTPAGRAVKGTATLEWLGLLDKAKGGAIRRGTMAGDIDRYFNGVRGMWRTMDEQLEGLRRRPGESRQAALQRQLEGVVDNPKLARQFQDYLDDVMGSWNAISRLERIPAQLLIFYPFLRMSLRWTLWSFPKRHPIKASVLYYLGQQNAWELRRFLKGDPSFWQQWGRTVVHGTEKGQGSIMDPTRAAPGANVFMEALGGTTDHKGTGLLKGLQPGVAAIVTAATGVTGLGVRTKQSGVEAIAQLLSLAAPARVIQAQTGGRDPGELPFLSERESSQIRDLIDKIDPESRRLARSAIFPPAYPLDIGGEQDRLHMSRLLETIRKEPDRKQFVKLTKEALPKSKVDPSDKRIQNVIDKLPRTNRLKQRYEAAGLAKDALRALLVKYGVAEADDDTFGRTYGAAARAVTGKILVPVQEKKLDPFREKFGLPQEDEATDWRKKFGLPKEKSGGDDFYKKFGIPKP
jgi:hypothetical protein